MIPGNSSDFFESMPSIEAVRMIFSLFVSRRSCRGGKGLKVRVFDMNRAYFNTLAARKHWYSEVPMS